ncbi:MaoC family dehydratase [Aminobacterium sp. UBA5514]|uniref:MaoC family dehydratase n=1 Tax=Aminobacterium sp. UBA5514 TaxID=1946036 RepID=UPI00257F3B86|nr:MaoC family dehydratase [Aminobacterium sp. UBA5514]
METSKMGSFYEDFLEGEIIYHALSKTIFESDNNFFCLLTMNHHPVHLNEHYARNQQHGCILVVGTLVFSLVVGMTVPDISGRAIANLSYEKIEHLAPVFIGDTLYARTQILSKRLSKTKLDRGIICVETVGYNQENIDVLRFKRTVLVKRKGEEIL